MGGGTIFKVVRHKCELKNYIKFLWFELATVTSQALKYDVINSRQACLSNFTQCFISPQRL